MTLEDLIDLYETRVDARFYGKYAAVVRHTDDPLGIGRLRAHVPAVLGEEVLTGWALPCLPYGGGKDRGMVFMPEIGDSIWIEFAAGDISQPIWAGTFFGAPENVGGADDLGKEAGAETPTDEDKPAGPGRHMVKTKAGHTLVLDDDGEVVLLANGNGKASIRLAKDGSVTVTAETIKLGANASEKLVLGDSFMQLFNQHTHPTGVGPSGPPTPPIAATHLSAKVTTE